MVVKNCIIKLIVLFLLMFDCEKVPHSKLSFFLKVLLYYIFSALRLSDESILFKFYLIVTNFIMIFLIKKMSNIMKKVLSSMFKNNLNLFQIL